MRTTVGVMAIVPLSLTVADLVITAKDTLQKAHDGLLRALEIDIQFGGHWHPAALQFGSHYFSVKRTDWTGLPFRVTWATALVPASAENVPVAANAEPFGSRSTSCLLLPESNVSLAVAPLRSWTLPWSLT